MCLQFDEFAESHGLHYNKRNLRELELYESAADGATVGKYGARHTNCEEFRQFLSGIKAQKYHLQYASVKCGAMTFSFCMAFACQPHLYVAYTTSGY
ncbi:unnamed protein product [Strongylus vulgaris]|uniref:Uncharacterized protein n=1 Tax=Strongylus vulgaris TaxID=40348 RepID=A0A3P7LK72_STRVU|nr:unnamed protein product [Strongylus vulgaris]